MGARHSQEARCLPIATPACMSHVAAVWRRLKERPLQGQLGSRKNERIRLLGNASLQQGGGDVFPKSFKVLARHANLKYPGIGSVYGPFYDTEDRRF